MVHRMQDEEALRWKRKFLDALEEHELRQCLRNDDRETGLELLLEQIEKTIVRLDTEKNQSTRALQQAFSGAIAELQQVPLPGSTRRQLKKFSRSLPCGTIRRPLL